MGKDVMAMKVMVGKEALSMEDYLYLVFLERFESKILVQGTYEARTIFENDDSDGPLRAAAWVTARGEHHR